MTIKMSHPIDLTSEERSFKMFYSVTIGNYPPKILKSLQGKTRRGNPFPDFVVRKEAQREMPFLTHQELHSMKIERIATEK